MKIVVLFIAVLLVGCSSLTTTDQRGYSWNGPAAVSRMKHDAEARQRASDEFDRMLNQYPARSFDLQLGLVENRPVTANQTRLTVPVKMNFNREWLIKFWQLLYALNEDNGNKAQITVKSLYDAEDTRDVYDTVNVVRGTARFSNLEKFNKIQARMVNTKPLLRVTLYSAQRQVLLQQYINVPELTHDGIYAGIPAFVDIGYQQYRPAWNFKYPNPYQMVIDGHMPIYTSADITVDNAILAKTANITIDIVVSR